MARELDGIAGVQSVDTVARGVALAEQQGFEVRSLSECVSGPIWKAILDSADQRSSAAIVVGSRGLSGLSAALGSVSNGVVHHSRRPVLVVPSEDSS